MPQPNVLEVLWGILKIQSTVEAPDPSGTATVDHTLFASILESIGSEVSPNLAEHDESLAAYVAYLSRVDPDDLSEPEALAFWLNLYNAGALRLAAEAQSAGHDSVLRLPGAFSDPRFEVAGETLSLDAVEHGKVRRFSDPRIHAALVCGSVSCPTLRDEPYVAGRLESQLEDQMRSFLSSGGAVLSDDRKKLDLNKIFLWYGADFTRPRRMPTIVPTTKRRVAASLERWSDYALSQAESIEFQSYDWGLRCTLG